MSFWLYCDRATTGGMNLIRALGGKRIKAGRSRFRWNRKRTVLNWGCTTMGNDAKFSMKNGPEDVAMAVDKQQFFLSVHKAMRQEDCVPATNQLETAKGWLKEGSTVVARNILNGHSGAGIVIVGPKKGVLPDSPLFTKYIPKDEEYRVHLLRHTVAGVTHVKPFFLQKKVKRPDFQGKPNRMVRSYDNGYMYQHSNIEVPKQVTDAAMRVFGTCTNLDWGAVDVIFVRAQNKAYVLEINTAPGLDEYSAQQYAAAFKEYF